MPKTKELFELHKLPDHIIIKELRKEIGQLESYIDELEYDKEQLTEYNTNLKHSNRLANNRVNNLLNKKLNKRELKEIKSETILKGIISENISLKDKIKTLERKNELMERDFLIKKPLI